MQLTRRVHVPPATHPASSNTASTVPPMGMRARLKASYAIPSSFSTEARALLTAMKGCGMIVADKNGRLRRSPTLTMQLRGPGRTSCVALDSVPSRRAKTALHHQARHQADRKSELGLLRTAGQVPSPGDTRAACR